MASLQEIYFKKETLQQLVDVLNAKGENGVSITLSVNDEAKYYNGKNPQHISGYVKQSKEDKDAGKQKFYVTNGRCVWSNDGSFVPPYEEQQPTTGVSDAVIVQEDDSLPF